MRQQLCCSCIPPPSGCPTRWPVPPPDCHLIATTALPPLPPPTLPPLKPARSRCALCWSPPGTPPPSPPAPQPCSPTPCCGGWAARPGAAAPPLRLPSVPRPPGRLPGLQQAPAAPAGWPLPANGEERRESRHTKRTKVNGGQVSRCSAKHRCTDVVGVLRGGGHAQWHMQCQQRSSWCSAFASAQLQQLLLPHPPAAAQGPGAPPSVSRSGKSCPPPLL